MKTTITTALVGVLLLFLLGQCNDGSKPLIYEDAMRFRTNYKNAHPAVIRKLFGEKAAKDHKDTVKRLASVAFTKDEMDHLDSFFMGKSPDFSKIEPNVKFDGYRFHVGIDTTSENPKEVYILTFGDEIRPSRDSVYLQDRLNLKIYHVKNMKLDFDKFPKPHKHGVRILTHLSCYPNCDGDELK